MKESPKSGMPASAVNRLRNANVSGGVAGHPDANLLSAFTEQALPAAEREEVLAHLALCADCREVVALSAPVVEEKQAGERAGAGSWFAKRPEFMRWGIVGASAAVVVAAVLLVKPEIERNSFSKDANHSAKVQDVAPANEQAAAPAPPKPVAQSEPKAQSADAGALNGPVQKRQDEQRDAFASSDMKMARRAEPAGPGGIGAGSGAGIGGGLVGGVMAGQPKGGALASTVKQENAPLTAPPGSAPAAAERVAAAPAPVNAVAMDRAEAKEAKIADKMSLADAAKAKSGEQAEAATNDYKYNAQMQARAMAPVAAKDDENAVLKKTMRAVVHTWRIVDARLQMSSDAGQSWRPASLPGGVKALAVDSGQPLQSSVWVGGANGALLRSHDNGATWEQVKGGWTGDVVYVRFADAKLGTLKTSSKEVWVTEDGGATWKKK